MIIEDSRDEREAAELTLPIEHEALIASVARHFPVALTATTVSRVGG